MKTKMHAHALAALLVELLLTLCICVAIGAANLRIVQNQVIKYEDEIATDYNNLADRYISVFKALVVHIEAQIKKDPSFEEMQAWLQSQESAFAEAVGKDAYDGFAMTYKGGYAHSWHYGEYSHYNPNTRPWYQEAARAQGKAVVVAPYFSYLGASKLKADQVIIMTVAQKYSDSISFDLDLKIDRLDNLVARHDPYYAGTLTMILNKNGFILSSTNKALYAYGIEEENSPLSPELRQTLVELRRQPGQMRFLQLDGKQYFSYAKLDELGNLYVAFMPFWEIFSRRLFWIIVIFLGLSALEIWTYKRHKHVLKELSERDMRILRALAFYFDGVYVGSVNTSKFEVIKEDKYYARECQGEQGQEAAFSRMALRQISEESREGFLEAVSRTNVQKELSQGHGFSINVQMQDGHWLTLRFVRSEDYDVSGEFVFFVENADEEMQKRQVLEEALTAANKATVAKSEFLSRMSHEIRTPMNAIVGLTAIARCHEENPEQMEAYLQKIDASSKVLLSIINDVLDMSAIANGKLKIAQVEFNLQALLNSLATIYYTQCHQKGVHFSMAVDVKNELLLGDSLRVNQILMNLVSNAFKFTPAGGRITIKVHEDRTEDDVVFIQFQVSDTGVGMDQEMLGRLFQPFEQENAVTAKKYGGSGLGLSITKNLVDLLQGNISVTSAKGEGTTFTVELPFKTTGQTAQVVDKSKFASLRVLVVDDEQSAREYTGVLLKRLGVNFDMATSGEEGLAKVEAAQTAGKPYNICLLDWKMPGLSGIDVTKKLRELAAKDMLVIIVSSYDTSSVEEDATAAGADMFVAKPLFQSTLFNLLVQMLGGRYGLRDVTGTGYDFTGHRVLVAEDNAINSEVARELLRMVKLQCDFAEDGQLAVDKFKNASPGTYDLILMDIQMPVLDGYGATKAIRALPRPDAKTIPIFAMTADAFTEDVSTALACGMNGHLAKPIDVAKLYAVIAGVIGKKKTGSKATEPGTTSNT